MLEQVLSTINIDLFAKAMVITLSTIIIIKFFHWIEQRFLLKKAILESNIPRVFSIPQRLWTLMNSIYQSTAGGELGEFFDADLHLSKPNVADTITEQMAEIIRDIITSSASNNWKVCFIEKDSGPVGMITSKDLIEQRLKMATTVVRIKRRLISAAFKGEKIKKGDKVILITDVITSGLQTQLARKKIEKLGARVSYCVAIVDRRTDAGKYIEGTEIIAKSITTLKELKTFTTSPAFE